MLPTLSPQEFVAKWSKTTLKERSAAQEHFLDLCHVVGHPTPAESDPTGQTFAFEAGSSKQRGGQGWADVWKKGYFAWEYKGKHKNLDHAYQQLLQYREALFNPPLLVVSDMETVVIHTNFTNTVKRVIQLTLQDLLKPEGIAQLRVVFFEPDAFKIAQTTEHVTQEAARAFARLADRLRQQGAEPQAAAHFLIRLLFCLFAEDIGLLPKNLLTQLVNNTRKQPAVFQDQLRLLFRAMAVGGWFGITEIAHFDGKLFNDETALALDSECLEILAHISVLDWSNIEPSIFGTLFERSLDPSKRSQLGAHYTSKDDIRLIVEPVLMTPLRRRWQEVQQQALALARRRDAADAKRTRSKAHKDLTDLLIGFATEIAQVHVLDPACGSGNFLYVALKQLLDLEKEIIAFASDVGVSGFFPQVSPTQLHGIELNAYAYELAQATIWIGFIQWLHDNGFGAPREPILKPLETILQRDAILAYDAEGQPVDPEWPQVDVVIGNPPFLGNKKMRAELGDKYVDDLRNLYNDRIPGESDLVCYWFEKARAMIAEGKLKRAGLLATQGIRGGANRVVLERIKATGDIFWAQSDRDWILEGAAVHISMVGFHDGSQTQKYLDDQKVSQINADLTSDVDLTDSKRLPENQELSFMGITPAGPFDIPGDLARQWLNTPLNPHGRPNSDVVHPYYNGKDLTGRLRDVWIIDFEDMNENQAALYELPFEYVLKTVKPVREKSRIAHEPWWLFTRSRSAMRKVLQTLPKYIGTSMVSKHHIFVWIPSQVLPANLIIVIARADDYFFGILHSKVHELWALRLGTALEDRPRYTPTTTFETFPFPWPPGQEPGDDPRVQAIAAAACELVQKRDAWLNPLGASAKDLKSCTLTNLYNQRPTWLDLAHRKLDETVLQAYGWPLEVSDEEILARLLALNQERATRFTKQECQILI
jgi:type II restriction/modification system DNA methylase subunit YeeA